MKRRLGGLTIVVMPDESGESRSFRLTPRATRIALTMAILLVVVGGAIFTSWWYLAFQTVRSWQLRTEVASLREERTQVLTLAEELTRIESEYEHIRSLFGMAEAPLPSDLWLPPAGLPGSDAAGQEAGSDEHVPNSWPLTEPGFITQALIARDAGDHPGLDIAVPTDSYVRAAGAGKVLRVGEDPLYGLFVVLDHGEGYQSVYAHASMILVQRGQEVRREEVIALSGSTGQSTAPHLHFEILLDGLPVDPLSMVEQPN
jgi:murein DD-endopeptidase MepM/ murein hydrolase activator NlpD